VTLRALVEKWRAEGQKQIALAKNYVEYPHRYIEHEVQSRAYLTCAQELEQALNEAPHADDLDSR